MRITARGLPAVALVLAMVALLGSAEGRASDVVQSYAVVRDDGTLLIRNRIVRLAGIYIPENDQLCQRSFRPVPCGNRAALALDVRIQGFIRCEAAGINPDGTVSAFCFARPSRFGGGEDLGAFLIEEGLAVALPGAPFEYSVLERIAQVNRRGIWGFQVDRIR